MRPPDRSPALRYLYDRFVAGDPGRVAAYEREVARARREMEGARAEPAPGGPDESIGGQDHAE